MPTVTVPGSSTGSPAFTYTFSTSTTGLTVAQQIANALAAAVTSGTLNVTSTTVTGASTVSAAPTVGSVRELIIAPTASGAYSVPSGYLVLNEAQATVGGTVTGVAVTINAAPGTIILTGNGGGLFTESGSGGATIVASGGNNVISQTGGNGGSGTIFLAGGSGNDTISGDGAGTIASGSGTDSIFSNNNFDFISATGTDSIVFGGAATGTAASGTVPSAFADTVFAGAGVTVSIYGAVNGTPVFQSTIAGGPQVGIAYLEGNAGGKAITSVPTASGAAGTTPTVAAPSGGLVYQTNGASSSTVNATAGMATVYGSSGSSVNLLAGTSSPTNPDYAVAGGGNETLNATGSTSPVWLSVNTTVSGPSSVALVGGGGNDTLIAGSAPGSVTMTGAGGSNAFVFFKQAAIGGPDVVTDFLGSTNSVFISGYGAVSGSASDNAGNLLGSHSSVGSGGVTLTLNDGTQITFQGLTAASQLAGKIEYTA